MKKLFIIIGVLLCSTLCSATVTKTTTSVTVTLNNTGLVSLSAGGTVNITVVGTQ